MRAIDYPCGHRLEGADGDELLRLAREALGVRGRQAQGAEVRRGTTLKAYKPGR